MIDEAIATLNRLGYPIKIETMSLEEDRHIKKAIQLGIEALERLQELRIKTPVKIYLIEKPLPSEGEK